jgi:GTP-binding protein
VRDPGQTLFALGCRLEASVGIDDPLPPEREPEVAFAGRSNAGKSSLLNALVGCDLARISRTPGTTKRLAFYRLGSRLTLVDLPGYGYAAKGRATVAAWQGMVARYFEQRRVLRCVCLLIDAKVGPKDSDRTALASLAAFGIATRIVATKIDRAPGPTSELERLVAEFAGVSPDVLRTSAVTAEGLPALRRTLASLAAFGRDGL